MISFSENSLALLLCASLTVAASITANEICAAEGSENTLIPAELCSQYYICSQGAPLVQNCQANLYFNPEGFCDWPENVDCVDKIIPSEPEGAPIDAEAVAFCADESSEGALIPAKDCKRFYQCTAAGLAVGFKCNDGLVYNIAGWCDWTENVDCSDRSYPELSTPEEDTEKTEETPIVVDEPEAPVDANAAAICAEESSNGILVPANDCAKFYKCSEGQAVVFQCQSGLLYNPAGWCDWSENVNCNTRSIPDAIKVAKST